jgi:hypothetical protein
MMTIYSILDDLLSITIITSSQHEGNPKYFGKEAIKGKS